MIERKVLVGGGAEEREAHDATPNASLCLLHRVSNQPRQGGRVGSMHLAYGQRPTSMRGRRQRSDAVAGRFVGIL